MIRKLLKHEIFQHSQFFFVLLLSAEAYAHICSQIIQEAMLAAYVVLLYVPVDIRIVHSEVK